MKNLLSYAKSIFTFNTSESCRRIDSPESSLPHDSDSEGDPLMEETYEPSHKPLSRWAYRPLLTNALLLGCNIAFFFIGLLMCSHKSCPVEVRGHDRVPSKSYQSSFNVQSVLTPRTASLKKAIAYTVDDLLDRTVYINGTAMPDEWHQEFGSPSPVTDAAWAEIVQRE